MTTITAYFLFARHHATDFTGHVLSSLILISTLGGRHYDYPYFIIDMHFKGHVLTSLILISTLGGGHYYYPYFITEKTERIRNVPRVTQLESNGAEMQTPAFSDKAHALKQLSNATFKPEH